MKKYHKMFDVYCDNCGEVTVNYDTFNEWQEHEESTISLTVCKKCQYEDWKKQQEKSFKKEVDEIVKKDNKSVDKRKGVCYTISKMIRKGS